MDQSTIMSMAIDGGVVDRLKKKLVEGFLDLEEYRTDTVVSINRYRWLLVKDCDYNLSGSAWWRRLFCMMCSPVSQPSWLHLSMELEFSQLQIDFRGKTLPKKIFLGKMKMGLDNIRSS